MTMSFHRYIVLGSVMIAAFSSRVYADAPTYPAYYELSQHYDAVRHIAYCKDQHEHREVGGAKGYVGGLVLRFEERWRSIKQHYDQIYATWPVAMRPLERVSLIQDVSCRQSDFDTDWGLSTASLDSHFTGVEREMQQPKDAQ